MPLEEEEEKDLVVDVTAPQSVANSVKREPGQ